MHFSPSRNAGESRNIDTSTPIQLDSAGNPMLKYTNGGETIANSKNVLHKEEKKKKINSIFNKKKETTTTTTKTPTTTSNELQAVAEFESQFRQLSASVFLETSTTMSSTVTNYGPYHRLMTTREENAQVIIKWKKKKQNKARIANGAL